MTKSRGIRTPRGEAEAYFYRHLNDPVDGCKIWPYNTDKDGYGYVWLKGSGRYSRVTVLACENRWGLMPSPGMVAAHGPCTSVLCWEGEHLTWKTHLQNAADRLRDGTALVGEKNPRARLTEVDVREIRSRASRGVKYLILAEEFSTTEKYISSIVTRLRWRHISDEEDLA